MNNNPAVPWATFLRMARIARKTYSGKQFNQWGVQMLSLIKTGQWCKLPTSNVTWRKPTVLGGV